MPRGVPRIKDASELPIPPSAIFDMNTLVDGGPDIVVAPADADFKKLCEDEKFLNEPIVIRCKATGNNNDPKAVELMVQTGGVTGKMGAPTDEYPDGVPGRAGRGGKLHKYVFAYDRKYTVPRFIFEALANARVTTLRQTPHPTKPMEMLQQNVHTYSYNFECVSDPAGKKGEMWREQVMARAA